LAKNSPGFWKKVAETVVEQKKPNIYTKAEI
jgi:hypothetical protein